MSKLIIIAFAAGLGLLAAGSLGAATTNLPEPEGMFSVTPVLDKSCLAVQIRLGEKEALSGLKWYSSDDQPVFAKLLVAAGLEGQPPLYDDGVTMAMTVGGGLQVWNDLELSEPVVSETGVLYAIFQLPDGKNLASDRIPQLGYRQEDNGGVAYLSSDAKDWVRLQPGYQVQVEPVLTERKPGVLTLTATAASKAKESKVQEVPRRTELNDPYPNPFNPVTSIEFALAEPGQVELEVFDLRGFLVKRLVGGHYPAGRYVVEWSGENGKGVPVASGVYFFRLKTADEQFNRRAVLLK